LLIAKISLAIIKTVIGLGVIALIILLLIRLFG